jgi:DNA-binding response OmpR family regulator
MTYVNRKKRVLIIEDDRGLIKTLHNLLIIEGYDVLTSENGESGIRLAFDEMPDIIVCDIVLSRISGYDVLRILKANTKTSTIPFIFLTGKVKEKERAYGLELGADAYLDKPFEYQSLLDTMSRNLDSKSSLAMDAAEKW